MDIKALLRRNKGDKAASLPTLAEAVAAAQVERDRLDAVLAEMNARRTSRLLDADDAELDGLERDIQLSTRARDRVDAQTVLLQQRLAEAQTAEAQARRDALHAQAVAARDRGVELLRQYEAQAMALQSTLFAIDAQNGVLRSAILELASAGDESHIETPAEVMRPPGGGFISNEFLSRVVLPAPAAAHLNLWPCNDTETRANGESAARAAVGKA